MLETRVGSHSCWFFWKIYKPFLLSSSKQLLIYQNLTKNSEADSIDFEISRQIKYK